METASAALRSDLLSTLTTMTLLPWAVGRELRALESAAAGSRTVPMTVVLGRERYCFTKPLPMPSG